MKKLYILTGSVTYALAARDILKSHNIRAYIKRQPNNLKRVGCGYGVVTEEKAVNILKENNIKILEIKTLM